MKKVFVTVAIFGALFTALAISTPTTAGRSKALAGLAPLPAPAGAGGGIATPIGLVTSPKNLLFALRGGGTTDFWQYTISANTWGILANTPAPVEDGGAIVQIHAFSSCIPDGGRYYLAALRGGYTTDFWFFSIKENAWCAGPNTPAAVGPGGALTQLQGRGHIYALRGGGTPEFWQYDGVWTRLADAPGPVQAGGGLAGINHGIKSRNDLIYALQGGGSSAVWRYDADIGTWSHLADTPAPIGSGGAIASSNVGTGDDGTLIILQGGGSTKAWTLDVNTEGNVWREINGAPTPVTTGGAIAAQFNGCNFALAGGGSNEFFTTGTRDCLVADESPDFSIAFTQSTVTTTQGSKIKVQLNIEREAGFTGKITLSQVSPKLLGIVVPENLQLPESDSIKLKIKVKGTALKGSFPITFAGTDTSGRVRNAVLTLVVE